MASELLQKAREYEARQRPPAEELLPLFHLTGGVGWINDPNGFSLYRGEIHLFFQYYPYDIKWGPMHWGHAKTKDFVRWELLPAALAPDTEADRDGCFSGTAIETPDGKQLLLYTGVNRDVQPDGSIQETELQCIAVGDGLDYEKSHANPVITAADLPKGGSSRDFRDPKIWHEENYYYALIADRGPDGSGELLLYRSEDALTWHYRGVFASCKNRYGTMWECPDIFLLDGKAVLLHSAHEMRAEGLEFHPGNGTVCHIGHCEDGYSRFIDETVHSIEYGLDFYAPQTIQTEDGRRILIAWMQSWESAACQPEGLPFFGQMTIPRELRVKNGRLCQWPVREIEAYRREPVLFRNVSVREETSLPQISGRSIDLILKIRPDGTEPYRRFVIRVAEGEGCYTEILLNAPEGTIRLDRIHSGFPHDIVHVREFPAWFHNGEISLRLLLDRYSLELFAGEGEQAASMTLYTTLQADGITFASDAPVIMDVEKYEIKM